MIMPRILVHLVLNISNQVSRSFANWSIGVPDFIILVGSDKLSSDKLTAERSEIFLDG
jgi:hypothetical protein